MRCIHWLLGDRQHIVESTIDCPRIELERQRDQPMGRRMQTRDCLGMSAQMLMQGRIDPGAVQDAFTSAVNNVTGDTTAAAK
jgi:hypothetical protein